MCGILGVLISPSLAVEGAEVRGWVSDLLRLSMERGRDSSGIAVLSGQTMRVLRAPVSAARLVRSPAFKAMFGAFPPGGPRAVIGHARLMTQGVQGIDANNQPVSTGAAVGIHNGIVVNDAEIWRAHPEQAQVGEVDTEALLAALESHRQGRGLVDAARATYAEIVGSASIAVMFSDDPRLLLATNTGSLYFYRSRDLFVFASEAHFLEKLFKHYPDLCSGAEGAIVRISPGEGVLVDLVTLERTGFSLAAPADASVPEPRRPVFSLLDTGREAERQRRSLRRCTRCILPETIPQIHFDTDGVCNFCRDYHPMPHHGLTALRDLVAPHRRQDGGPDCVVALSGGRDSCYALHFVKRVLGLNPIAYTYDWALVTDLARRNQARMCGALNVEHVIVAADIKRKRRNIRDNIEAWMRRPDLGMVPLFMAGDKFYFHHLERIRQRYGLGLAFIGGNRLEKTNFKTGFCGVTNEGTWRLYDVGLSKKFRLASYYAGQFLTNPAYLNRSLFDTAFAFKVSYFGRHDFCWLYDYIGWDEAEIDRTLREQYDWEVATDTDSTWRIGDGTAAFYNYIYYTVAGFSEIDTFRSNQVREGMIDRDQALACAERENAPRFESIRDYANLVGFDFDEAMAAINAMPKLY